MTKTVTSTPRRLSEIAPAGGSLTPMADLEGRDLRLIEARARQTEYGRGYLMTVVDVESGEAHEVLSSAVVVVKQLDQVRNTPHDGDPFAEFLIRFEKAGRCWIIA